MLCGEKPAGTTLVMPLDPQPAAQWIAVAGETLMVAGMKRRAEPRRAPRTAAAWTSPPEMLESLNDKGYRQVQANSPVAAPDCLADLPARATSGEARAGWETAVLVLRKLGGGAERNCAVVAMRARAALVPGAPARDRRAREPLGPSRRVGPADAVVLMRVPRSRQRWSNLASEGGR